MAEVVTEFRRRKQTDKKFKSAPIPDHRWSPGKTSKRWRVSQITRAHLEEGTAAEVAAQLKTVFPYLPQCFLLKPH